jgi:hypothetical protein
VSLLFPFCASAKALLIGHYPVSNINNYRYFVNNNFKIFIKKKLAPNYGIGNIRLSEIIKAFSHLR